jgi:hypothetical protein
VHQRSAIHRKILNLLCILCPLPLIEAQTGLSLSQEFEVINIYPNQDQHQRRSITMHMLLPILTNLVFLNTSTFIAQWMRDPYYMCMRMQAAAEEVDRLMKTHPQFLLTSHQRRRAAQDIQDFDEGNAHQPTTTGLRICMQHLHHALEAADRAKDMFNEVGNFTSSRLHAYCSNDNLLTISLKDAAAHFEEIREVNFLITHRGNDLENAYYKVAEVAEACRACGGYVNKQCRYFETAPQQQERPEPYIRWSWKGAWRKLKSLWSSEPHKNEL